MTNLTGQIAMPNLYRTCEPESSRDSVLFIIFAYIFLGIALHYTCNVTSLLTYIIIVPQQFRQVGDIDIPVSIDVSIPIAHPARFTITTKQLS